MSSSNPSLYFNGLGFNQAFYAGSIINASNISIGILSIADGGTGCSGLDLSVFTTNGYNLLSINPSVGSVLTGINASNITTGSISSNLLSSINASNITSGTLPIILGGTGTTTGLSVLNASNITTGTLPSSLLSTINASNITTGTLAISNGGTGTTTGLTALNASNLTTGTLSSTLLSSINASNISTGTLAISNGGTGCNNIDSTYFNWSGNFLTFNSSALLSAINASNISTGILSVAHGGTGLSTLVANELLIGNGTGAILQSSNLFWNNSNGYLGIGTNSPGNILTIGGAGRLRIANSNSDYTLIGTNDTDGTTNTRVVVSGYNRTSNNGNIEYVATNTTGKHIFYTNTSTTMQTINSNGILVNGAISTNVSGSGNVLLVNGSTAQCGFIAFYNPSGTRYGYIGYAAPTANYLYIENENGCLGYEFSGNVIIDNTLNLQGTTFYSNADGLFGSIKNISSYYNNISFATGLATYVLGAYYNNTGPNYVPIITVNATTAYNGINSVVTLQATGSAISGSHFDSQIVLDASYATCNAGGYYSSCINFQSQTPGGWATNATFQTSGSVPIYANFFFYGNVHYYTLTAISDEKYKTNITTISNALDTINQLRGVTYNLSLDNDKLHYGLISQEVQTVIPDIVNDMKNKDGGTDLGLNYDNFIAILIEGIKELNNTVTTLQNQVNTLQAQVNTLTMPTTT